MSMGICDFSVAYNMSFEAVIRTDEDDWRNYGEHSKIFFLPIM